MQIRMATALWCRWQPYSQNPGKMYRSVKWYFKSQNFITREVDFTSGDTELIVKTNLAYWKGMWEVRMRTKHLTVALRKQGIFSFIFIRCLHSLTEQGVSCATWKCSTYLFSIVLWIAYLLTNLFASSHSLQDHADKHVHIVNEIRQYAANISAN